MQDFDPTIASDFAEATVKGLNRTNLMENVEVLKKGINETAGKINRKVGKFCTKNLNRCYRFGVGISKSINYCTLVLPIVTYATTDELNTYHELHNIPTDLRSKI